eukprot:TRINITY_DN2272_c0_g1_i1.p1 TRINITY_DN2272_c0_g1~~TRINITY_DN2272_c0_g1_i1.p1  ORF type:complete len:629 (-),score=112.89 TRINITY_DN2272_c0_g1_i1:28-1914(-)
MANPFYSQAPTRASTNPFLTNNSDDLDKAFAEIDFGDLKFNSSGGLSSSSNNAPQRPIPRLEHANSDPSLSRSPYTLSLVEPGSVVAPKPYNPNLITGSGAQSTPVTRQSSPSTPHFQSNQQQPSNPQSNSLQFPSNKPAQNSVPSTPNLNFQNSSPIINLDSPNQKRQLPPPVPKPISVARFSPSGPSGPRPSGSPTLSAPPPSSSPSINQPLSHNQPPPPTYSRSTSNPSLTSNSSISSSPSPSLVDSTAISNCIQCGSPIVYTPHPSKTVKVRCYNCPNINFFGGETDTLLQFQRDQNEKLSRAMSENSLSADNDSEGSGRNSEDTEDVDDTNSDTSNGKKKGGLTLRSFTTAAKQANKNIRAKAAETKTKVANSNFVSATKGAATAAANKTKIVAGKAADATKGAASKATNLFTAKEEEEASHQPNVVAQPPPPVFNPNTAIFKMPIQETVNRSAVTNPNVPEIVTKCIAYLDRRGFDEEGIFRISGSLQAIKSLRESFDRGEDVDIASVKDEHVVSGLLKLWFRELPDLIFARTDIDPYCLDVENVETVRDMIYNLPLPNYTILGVLFGLLDKVRNHSEKNKMTIFNLAIVFSPTLQCSTEAVTYILSHYHYIFDIPNDLLYW